jgi:putative FmdB family regulatory protein
VPIYTFICQDCGIKFESFSKSIETANNAAPCPECGKPATKKPSAASHSFAHKPTGPVPQNTGVSQIDHNFDRVIGRDAEEKWKIIEQRNAEKDRLIRHEREEGRGVGREHLVPTGEAPGTYRVITEGERKAANAGRQKAVKARAALPPVQKDG